MKTQQNIELQNNAIFSGDSISLAKHDITTQIYNWVTIKWLKNIDYYAKFSKTNQMYQAYPLVLAWLKLV